MNRYCICKSSTWESFIEFIKGNKSVMINLDQAAYVSYRGNTLEVILGNVELKFTKEDFEIIESFENEYSISLSKEGVDLTIYSLIAQESTRLERAILIYSTEENSEFDKNLTYKFKTCKGLFYKKYRITDNSAEALIRKMVDSESVKELWVKSVEQMEIK